MHNFDEQNMVVLRRGIDCPEKVRGSATHSTRSAPTSLRASAVGRRHPRGVDRASGAAVHGMGPRRPFRHPPRGDAVAKRCRRGERPHVPQRPRSHARINGEVKFVERIATADLPQYVQRRRGAMADARTFGLHLDSMGHPDLVFRDAISMMREAERPHWALDGPRAAAEGCGNPSSYHAEWHRLSGMSEGSAVCHQRRLRMEIIHVAACVDHLDLQGFCFAQNVVRRAIQHETAVELNSRHPDSSGFAVVQGGVTTSRGSVRVPRFREHIAKRQRERVSILEHGRMYREERDKDCQVRSSTLR